MAEPEEYSDFLDTINNTIEKASREEVMAKRCGKCTNCVKLEKVKATVLKVVNSPFSHADDGVVAVWNDGVGTWKTL